MNRSNCSTVTGGAEMNLDTSSVETCASSDGASPASSSRSVKPASTTVGRASRHAAWCARDASETAVVIDRITGAIVVWSVDDQARPEHPGLPPLVGQNRPQRRVEEAVVLAERAAQHAFPNRADLAQGAVAAPVFDRRPGLQALHAHHVNREVDNQARRVGEIPSAPKPRAES